MRGLGWCLILLLGGCGVPLPKVGLADPGVQVPTWPKIPPSQRLTIRGTLTVYDTEIPLTFRVLRGPERNLRVIALDDLGGTFFHVTLEDPHAFGTSGLPRRTGRLAPTPKVLTSPALPNAHDLTLAIFGCIEAWLVWPMALPNGPLAFDPTSPGDTPIVHSTDGRLGLLVRTQNLPVEDWQSGMLMLGAPGAKLVDEVWIANESRVQCTAQFRWKAGRWDTARIQDHKRDLQLDLQLVTEAEAQFQPEDFTPPDSRR